MLPCLNEARRELALPSLRSSQRLDKTAQGHAVAMRKGGFFSHTNPVTGSTPKDRIKKAVPKARRIGEIIAKNFSSPTSVCYAWLQSPEHRRVIVSRYRKGIAGVGRSGSFWVVDFAGR